MRVEKNNNEDFDEVQIGPDEPIYTTGVVSKILRIPVWILKQLDKEGIVSPPREKEGQTRLYSKRELKMLQRCWYYMNQHHVKIPGLRVILKIERTQVFIERKR